MSVELVPFAGMPIRSLACSVFEFTESIYGAGLRIPKHAHVEPYIGITVTGEWQQELEGRCRRGRPWTVTLHPAGEIHSNRFANADARILNITITSNHLRQLLGPSFSLKHSASLSEGKAAWTAREIYREFGRTRSVSTMILNGLTLQLLAELLGASAAQAQKAIPGWLLRAKEMVETGFAAPLRLEALGATVGVHPVHLAREFRRRFHETVGHRIRDLRVARACQLLAESPLPLVEIAMEVGY
ncbi:MAG TPA: AraC family transcriptional regulator, partial [Candidatus Binataceae bacterium]|nr:AraC family transcriptional regulator [Candidatus Binataceae bacterium]